MPKEIRNELYENGLIFRSNIEHFGSPTREDWRRMNWGTRWNVEQTFLDAEGRKVMFGIPWFAPREIFRLLAKAVAQEGALLSITSECEEGGFSAFESGKDGILFLVEEGECFYNEEKRVYDYVSFFSRKMLA